MFSFDSIINSLKETVILFDKKSRMSFINKSGEELFKKSSRDIVGRRLNQLCTGEKKISSLIGRCISEERSFRGKSVSLDTCEQLNVDFSISPFYLNDRVEGAVLSISENITIAEQADHAQESLVYMLGSISHEIKNPLGGIKGAAQLLCRNVSDSSLTEYADLIILETDRLNAILQDYLTICRKPSFNAVNVHEIMEKALAIMAVPIEKAGVSIKRFYDPSLPQVLGDESKLLQVFLNIVKNAVESMLKGGRIEVSTYPSKELFGEHGKVKRMALLTIQDTGKGMTAEEIQKIFLPFYSGKKGGTGIGLALSKKIIKDHGGMISVKSRKGEGTSFFIYLPFKENG
jgi:two-component system, NtrC family, nitrogen regulation sensor histidine kinase GlnL